MATQRLGVWELLLPQRRWSSVSHAMALVKHSREPITIQLQTPPSPVRSRSAPATRRQPLAPSPSGALISCLASPLPSFADCTATHSLPRIENSISESHLSSGHTQFFEPRVDSTAASSKCRIHYPQPTLPIPWPSFDLVALSFVSSPSMTPNRRSGDPQIVSSHPCCAAQPARSIFRCRFSPAHSASHPLRL